MIVIQKALSKAQIDEVISLSREFRRPPSPVESEWHSLSLFRKTNPNLRHRAAEYLSPVRERPRERVTTEYLQVEAAPSPRSGRDTFIVEAAPSRHRSHSRHHHHDLYEEIVDTPRMRGISRPRSVSVHAPVQYIEQRESDNVRTGPMVLVRPRDSDHDVSDYIRELEEETRLLRLERQGGIEITRQRDTELIDNRGNEEEITEVRRQERKGTILQAIPILFSWF